jgi:hypothetical protein
MYRFRNPLGSFLNGPVQISGAVVETSHPVEKGLNAQGLRR